MDDDADIGAAVQRILAKGPEALGDAPAKLREDKRENRTDREPHEMQDDGDIEERANARDDEPEAEAEEAANDTNEEDDQFLEIPGETEDAEPVKIPLSEAADAVKQIRQMRGDIASAVIKAETEAQARQDEITGAIAKQFQELSVMAKTAVHAMQQYLPQPPDPNLRYSDPVAYADQKLYFEEYSSFLDRVKATIAQADDGRQSTLGQYDKTLVQRENERTARYIPEWKDEATRTAKREEILTALAPKYGFTKADLDDIVDHRAWRALADLAKAAKANTEAPVVRKAVQEKAAKLTNGKMPPREQGTGRFVSEAAKAHREHKNVDSFAQKLIASGALKGL